MSTIASRLDENQVMTHNCPMSRAKVVDAYFMEHRAKLIDIAAFLDRVNRADPAGSDDDYRLEAFSKALVAVGDGTPKRARRVLEIFSDPSTEMPQSAAGTKGANGAASPETAS